MEKEMKYSFAIKWFITCDMTPREDDV